MITEKDLQEAIAECQGERNPNANTCIKLAAYYTILNQMTSKTIEDEHSYIKYSKSAGPSGIDINSDSEFARIINGKNFNEVWPVIDELMETLKVMSPRLYDAVIKKLY